jgi:chaperonin cofactor prefoldin
VLVRFLQRYDKIEHLDADKPIKKLVGIALVPADGVKVRMRRAKS